MTNTLEQNARRAKEGMSFSDYRPGSATAEYNEYCKEADEIAGKARERLEKVNAPTERAERIDYLLNLYKAKKLSWMNDLYANRARVPSILITGGSNFPVRAKQKQNAREDSLMQQNPDYILDEIRGIGYNAKTIYSDDKNAVERIKAKIASLEAAPADRWGYNKTEIRRLKERLLQLAPDEMKSGKQITINGQQATFESIVNVFNSFKPQPSRYSPEENRFYLSIPFIISDGTRNYKCFVSCETDENGTEISTYGNADNGYKTIWKPLDDERKFKLMIGQMSGSGNKAVIYSILKDLDTANEVNPKTPETKSDTADTVTINGETAQVIRNKEEMRLQLIFDGKPDDKTREILKSNGFRWAPSCMAWQRLLNDNAEYSLKRIIAK